MDTYVQKVELKDNVTIDARECFDQAVKNDIKSCDNIGDVATSSGDDTIACLLYFPYFKENYKFIRIDLTKQERLETKLIHRVQDFTENLEDARNSKLFCVIEELGKSYFGFLTRNS